MKIYIKTAADKLLALEVEASDSVENLKSKIQESESQLVESITFNGVPLMDGQTLHTYNLEKEAIVSVSLKPKAEEQPTKCLAGCGFFGTPKFQNYCSKCFTTKNPVQKPIVHTPTASTTPLATASTPVNTVKTATPTANTEPTPVATTAAATAPAATPTTPVPQELGTQTRCGQCNKRVGLTAVQCRCGNHYCSRHRMPEEHTCNFDYKGLQRDILSKSNPQVVASKVVKI
jgi:hypothetical protein